MKIALAMADEIAGEKQAGHLESWT